MSCFTLQRSKFCPDYVGYTFKELGYNELKEVPFVLNNSNFDETIQSALKLHYDYLHQCSSTSYIPLYATWLCASLADNSKGCPIPPKPLCGATCFKFVRQLGKHTSRCSDNAQIFKLKSNVLSYCESIMFNNGNCITSKNNRLSCGYSSLTDIRKHCRHKKSLSKQTIDKGNITETVETVKRDPTISSALIITTIVIGSLVGLVLLILFVLWLLKWLKNRRIWRKAELEKNRFDETDGSPSTVNSLRVVPPP